jgi:hypothetical protein
MVRSWVSLFAATLTGAVLAPEMPVAVPFGVAFGVFVEDDVAGLPGVAGPV